MSHNLVFTVETSNWTSGMAYVLPILLLGLLDDTTLSNCRFLLLLHDFSLSCLGFLCLLRLFDLFIIVIRFVVGTELYNFTLPWGSTGSSLFRCS